MENKKKKNRNGVLVGAYVPKEVKTALQRIAKKQHMTVSQLLKYIFDKEIKEKTKL